MTPNCNQILKKEVIQWLIRTSPSRVQIAPPLSPSALMNRSSMRPGAIPTSPSVARLAEMQGKQSRTQAVAAASTIEATATAAEATIRLHGRCSPSSVQLAAKTPRCLLNPAATGRSIVQIVTARRTRLRDTNSNADNERAGGDGDSVVPPRLF